MAPEAPRAKDIRVYSRPGCHLCEQLIEELLPILRQRIRVDVVDIDTSASWLAKYGSRIPVVEYAGREICQYTLDAAAIHAILADSDDQTDEQAI